MADVPVIDFYRGCEDAVIALMKTLTDYFPQPHQVTRNVLDRNLGGDYILVVRPGGFPLGDVPGHNALVKEYSWNIMADLYVRYTEYEAAWANYAEVRAAIIFVCGTRPYLAGIAKNVTDFTVSSTSDPVYWQVARNQAAPNFILQGLRFSVTQRVTFPLAVGPLVAS